MELSGTVSFASTHPQDYSSPSAERRALLEELNVHLNGRKVSPVFWAGCVLGDTQSIQEVTATAKMKPNIIGLLMD